MKKILPLLLFLSFLLSCGPSVTVVDSWKAPDISESRTDNFLVMARADDMVARQRFEQEIAKQLRKSGVQATESYLTYPDLQLNKKTTPADIDALKARLEKDGINAIVLTVLKDTKKELNTTTTSYGPGYYPGFYGYYDSFYSPYGYGGAYMPASSRTYESEIYRLETVIFDLEREGDQLVAVVSINITDPKSASEVAPKYAEKVAEQFK